MKEDEKKFFITCLKYCPILDMRKIENSISPREVINIISQFINYKRCWYLLEKWNDKGFYNYGVNLELGWFEAENFNGEYKKIYEKVIKIES